MQPMSLWNTPCWSSERTSMKLAGDVVGMVSQCMYVSSSPSFAKKGKEKTTMNRAQANTYPTTQQPPLFKLSSLLFLNHHILHSIASVKENTQKSEKLCNTWPEFVSSPKLKKVHQLLVEAEEDCKLHSASDKSSSCCCFFPCCFCALSSVFIAGSKGSKLDSTASCCKASRKDEREKKTKEFFSSTRYDHCRASPLIFFHLPQSTRLWTIATSQLHPPYLSALPAPPSPPPEADTPISHPTSTCLVLVLVLVLAEQCSKPVIWASERASESQV